MKKLIEKIKKISLTNNRKKILKNYYSKELRKGKTYRASFLDRFLLYSILFIILTTILIINSDQILLSIFMASLALYFIIIANSYVTRKSKSKRITEINENLKKKKLIREFTNFNKENFNSYIQNLLGDYYDVEVDKAKYPLDLTFSKDGDLYGVKCGKYSMDEKITTRELDIFSSELRSLNIDDGVFITNTYFTDGLQDGTKIILMDFDYIVNILKDLDKYPSDEDMEDYIVDRFIDTRNTIKTQVKDFNKRKIIRLYGLCAVFYLLSFFISFPIYYKIMAVLAFVIATLVSGYKITEYIRLKDSLNIEKN